MLREALELLVKLGRDSDQPQKIQLPGNRIALATRGQLEIYDCDRAERECEVQTLESFVRWVKKIGQGREVEVFVGKRAISACVDYEKPVTDEIVLPLQLSAAMKALLLWSENPTPVPEVVNLLRTSLDGTFDKSYLPVFKRVDFSRMKASSIRTSHSGESMGRTVELLAQSSEGEIPEVVAFDINVFSLDIPFAKQKLRFAVNVNCDSERIGIRPIGDVVDQAFRSAKAELVDWLDSALDGCLILAGVDE